MYPTWQLNGVNEQLHPQSSELYQTTKKKDLHSDQASFEVQAVVYQA